MAKSKTPRLNDTKAIAAIPVFGGDKFSGERYESTSIHTRSVENGFVTRECKVSNGKIEEREYYHEKPHPAAAGDSMSLSRAVSYLNK